MDFTLSGLSSGQADSTTIAVKGGSLVWHTVAEQLLGTAKGKSPHDSTSGLSFLRARPVKY